MSSSDSATAERIFAAALDRLLDGTVAFSTFPGDTFAGDTFGFLRAESVDAGDAFLDRCSGVSFCRCSLSNASFSNASVKSGPAKGSIVDVLFTPSDLFGLFWGIGGGALLGGSQGSPEICLPGDDVGVDGTCLCGGGVAGCATGNDPGKDGMSTPPLGLRGRLGGSGAFRGLSPNASDSVFGLSSLLLDLAARSPGCCLGGSGGGPGRSSRTAGDDTAGVDTAGDELTDFPPLPKSHLLRLVGGCADVDGKSLFGLVDSARSKEGVFGSDAAVLVDRAGEPPTLPTPELFRFPRRPSISARDNCTGGGANMFIMPGCLC